MPQDDSPQSKPIKMSELVDYHPGSVVSREILRKGAGTITMFAFDQNQGLSEHTSPFDAAVFVLEGSIDVTVSGKPARLKEGEMIVMPALQPHALAAITPVKALLIMIRS